MELEYEDMMSEKRKKGKRRLKRRWSRRQRRGC